MPHDNAQRARTILDQLGANKFAAMTGAKNFVVNDAGLQFDLPRGARNKATRVQVTLTAADEYTMAFYRYDSKALALRPIEAIPSLQAEQLCATFKNRTGLDVSL